MRSLRVLPSADKDLDEAAIFYAEEAGTEVALRFLDAVQQAFDFVHANPAAGSPGQIPHPQARRSPTLACAGIQEPSRLLPLFE